MRIVLARLSASVTRTWRSPVVASVRRPSRSSVQRLRVAGRSTLCQLFALLTVSVTLGLLNVVPDTVSELLSLPFIGYYLLLLIRAM